MLMQIINEIGYFGCALFVGAGFIVSCWAIYFISRCWYRGKRDGLYSKEERF